MALDLGTLTGFLDLDASGFDTGLGAAADKLSDFGGKGAALAAGAGLAIGTALAAGVVGAMNVEAANDKLAAQLGLTASESERIGKVAGDLYAGAYGDSLGQVNNAVAAVISSIEGMGQASSADLQAVTANALDFATAMDVEVAGAAQTAGILLKTGLAADAREAFDLLTVAAQEAGPAMVEPIMEAANEYGVNFASMGISGRAAMAILVDASKGGEIALDKAGDAVKEFGIRATDLGDTGAQEALKALGLEGKEMANALLAGGDSAQEAFTTIVTGLQGVKDPAEQAALSVALFGTPVEDLSKDQLPAFLDAMNQAGGELENVAGAADAMGKTLNDNATTNLESFKRQVSTTFVDFVGGKALPIVNDIASALAVGLGPAFVTAGDLLAGLGDTVQAVSGFLGEHDTTTQVLAGTIAVLMLPTLVSLGLGYAATGTAAVASAALQSAAWLRTQVAALATGAILAVSYALTVAGWVASAAAATASGIAIAAAWVMALGPAGLVIAAVALFAAGLAFAWRNSQSFRDIVTGAFQKVLDAVSAVMGVWESMLLALGRVPGFGWATDAANAIGRARDTVDGFNASLDAIPARKSTTVTVTYQQVGSITSVPYRQRASGGPVDPYSSYLVGENGPELLTLGSARGNVMPAGATASVLAEAAGAGMSKVDLSELVEELRGLREEFRQQTRQQSRDRLVHDRTQPVRLPA